MKVDEFLCDKNKNGNRKIVICMQCLAPTSLILRKIFYGRELLDVPNDPENALFCTKNTQTFSFVF